MKAVILGLLFLLGVSVFADQPPQSFTYQGRLLSSDGSAVTSNAVTFTIKVLSHDGTCTLFEETHAKDLSSSNGFFNLSIGSGTNTGATSLTLLQVFDNSNNTKSGDSCNYTPSAGDYRQLQLKYSAGNGEVTLTPNHIILSTPNAMVSQTLQGKTPDGFVQVQGNITQTKLNDLAGKHSELMDLAGGTSNLYMKPGGASLSSDTALGLGTYSNASEGSETYQTGQIWYNSDSNQLKFYNGSSIQTLGVSGSGLSSLNGETGSSQSFAVNGSGTAPAINSSGNIHTLSIPLASGAGVTSGTISKTDYDNFASKVSTSGAAMTGALTNFTSTGVDDNADALAMTIDANERVGIGSTSPVSVLEVKASDALISITDGGSGNLSQIRSGATDTTFYADPSNATASTSMVFHVDGSESMRIRETGDVIIGTTNMSNKLGVSASSDNILGLQRSGVRTWNVGVNSDGKFFIDSELAGNDFFIDDDTANVGIGTTTPGQKLTVAGTIETTSGGVKFPDGSTQSTAATVSKSGELVMNLRSVLNNELDVQYGIDMVLHGYKKVLTGINAGSSSNYTNAGTDLVPVLSASGNEIEGSKYSACHGWYVFDSTEAGDSGCSSNFHGANGGHVGYNFGTGTVINKYTFTGDQTGSSSYNPLNWEFEGYNGSWVSLHSVSGASWSNNEVKSYELSNTTAYTQYRLRVTSSGGSYFTVNNLELIFSGDGVKNNGAMNLVSNSVAGRSIPATGHILIIWEDIDTGSTLNTDLVVSVSRDGTTYDTVTVTDMGVWQGNYRILYGNVALTGTGGDQKTMSYKLVTTTKEQSVLGVAFSWQ